MWRKIVDLLKRHREIIHTNSKRTSPNLQFHTHFCERGKKLEADSCVQKGQVHLVGDKDQNSLLNA